MDPADTLTCTQSRGAMASLLDWLSKIPETDPLLEARTKTQELLDRADLSYSDAHEHILTTTRNFGNKNYFLTAKEMEEDQRNAELDSIYFHISAYSRISASRSIKPDQSPARSRSTSKPDRQHYRDRSRHNRKPDRQHYSDRKKSTSSSRRYHSAASNSRGSNHEATQRTHIEAGQDKAHYKKRTLSCESYT